MMIESLTYVNLTLSSTKQAVTASPARVHGFEVMNIDNDDIHLLFYDALIADVTVGTTVPTDFLLIPASDATSRTGKDGYLFYPVKYNTGLVVAATKATGGVAGPSGSTAPDTAIAVSIRYS